MEREEFVKKMNLPYSMSQGSTIVSQKQHDRDVAVKKVVIGAATYYITRNVTSIATAGLSSSHTKNITDAIGVGSGVGGMFINVKGITVGTYTWSATSVYTNKYGEVTYYEVTDPNGDIDSMIMMPDYWASRM